jgi:hypothetical protein
VLLEREADGTKYRLLGVGLSALTTAEHADPADFVGGRAADSEHAVDRARARFGDDAVIRGLAFERPEKSLCETTSAQHARPSLRPASPLRAETADHRPTKEARLPNGRTAW